MARTPRKRPPEIEPDKEARRAIPVFPSEGDCDCAGSLLAALEKALPSSTVHSARVLESIRASGVSSLEELEQLALDREADLRVRENACWALGYYHAPSVGRVLLRLFEHEGGALVWEAAVALGKLRLPRIGQALLRSLDSEDPTRRAAAAHALGQLRYQRALRPLVAHLVDPTETAETRAQCAESLAYLRSKAAIAPLREVLIDAPAQVGFSAAFALGELGAVQALQDLEALARRPEAHVPGWGTTREAALLAIRKIREKGISFGQ